MLAPSILVLYEFSYVLQLHIQLFYFQDEESKTIMIQYKTRREAETAMLKSNQFTERSLQLTWHTISLGDSTGNLNYYRIEMIFVTG